MRCKKNSITNFGRTYFSQSDLITTFSEKELIRCSQSIPSNLLMRGSGLSYNDSALNSTGVLLRSNHLNHFIQFDLQSGLLICQAGILIYELFNVHPDYIPAVVPGTLFGTVGGAIAHDVHGKNNHRLGSFADHVLWIKLLISGTVIRCSRKHHQDLFHATIGGLGLTGIILQVGLFLQKKSPMVQVNYHQFNSLTELLAAMMTQGVQHDFQVAWLDLLSKPTKSILSLARHINKPLQDHFKQRTCPKFPFHLPRRWNMKLFNSWYFHCPRSSEQVSFKHYNNPLDTIKHWNRVYSISGLLQFQALFDTSRSHHIISELLNIMSKHNAVPVLAVLKLFTQTSQGILSFCRPGFTIAIDFVNNGTSRSAIKAMNHYIIEQHGTIYLAKDSLLNAQQFSMFAHSIDSFKEILEHYGCTMTSDLACRLGIR